MNRLPVGLSLLSLAACGLSETNEAQSPFPSDGVGAFQSASPIEVCLDTARIVAPALATGAGAICVPSEQTPRVCSSKDDCSGLEKCICGRCIVEPCLGGAACAPGEVCRGKRCTRGCGTDDECATNERCISGGCARNCSNDGDCHYGERCDSLDDVCVVSVCGSGGTCGAGSTCEAVAEVAILGEPAFLGDEPIAFVQLDRASERSIYRAEIISAQSWRVKPVSIILSAGPESIVGAPSVVRRDNQLDMIAAIGKPSRIVLARSVDDGQTFDVVADPLLEAADPWENGSVGSPSVFDFQGSTFLLYEGGQGAGIGLAKVLTNHAHRTQPNPILFPASVMDPVFWRDITNVGRPQAVVVGDSVRILFTARGIEGFSAMTSAGNAAAEPNDSIGLATTIDLQSFALFPTGPVYTRLVNLRAYLGESEATMRMAPNGAEMVFVSSDASGEAKTGLVRVLGRGGAN